MVHERCNLCFTEKLTESWKTVTALSEDIRRGQGWVMGKRFGRGESEGLGMGNGEGEEEGN